VNEGGGLKGMLATFAAEIAAGELVELVVDQGKKLVDGFFLALADFTQQPGNFPRFVHPTPERDYSAGMRGHLWRTCWGEIYLGVNGL
jgi:hypothetical protein